MLISVKHRFAVILTPKCASNSIEEVITPYSDIVLRGIPALRHTDFRTYSSYLKPYLDHSVGGNAIETTCLIREPLSWLNSHYRFRTRIEIRNRQSRNFRTSTFGISFADFIEAYISPDPPPFAQFRSQFDFVKDDSDKIGVDRMFAYENIDDFLAFIGTKVGKKLGTRYLNVSPRHGSELRLAVWLDYVERKVTGRLGWKRSKQQLQRKYELPEDLLVALRKFIPDDFALYESVKSTRSRPA